MHKFGVILNSTVKQTVFPACLAMCVNILSKRLSFQKFGHVLLSLLPFAVTTHAKLKALP